MIGTVTFYQLPGSPATGEYPVLASASTDPSAYKSATYSNCKFTKDYRQRITIADFDAGYTANSVLLTSGTWRAWYWITDRAQSSIVNGATEFAIEYNPITSKLTQSQSLPGWWTRAPVNIAPWKQQLPISGVMETQQDRYQEIAGSTVTISGDPYRLYWVQITAKYDLINEQDGLVTYGFPIAISLATDPNTFTYEYVYSSTDGSVSSSRFPTLDEIINNPTCFGLSSASDLITDISVSPVIPWNFHIWTSSGSIVLALYGITSGTAQYTAASILTTSATRLIYETYPGTYQVSPEKPGSVSITDTEAACGSITLTDNQGAEIAQIPVQWFDDNSLTYTYTCIADYGQMLIIISLGTRYMYQIPCTHLPFIGTAWESYAAYSQSFDREAMEYSISATRQSLDASTKAQTANSIIGAVGKVMSGDIGGAVSGLLGQTVSTVTNYKLQDIADAQTRYTQDLTERRIQAQPAAIYGSGYGKTWIAMVQARMPGFAIALPAGLTEDIFDSYVKRFGYSVEGYYELTLSEGYYQGRIPMTGSYTGAEYERVNEILMSGVYMVFI